MDSFDQRTVTGDRLRTSVPVMNSDPAFMLLGQSGGKREYVPISEDILEKHILMIGGIGTGKTNLFNSMIRSIRNVMNSNDIMVIFDTKGDFYREFYTEGDIVISNDEKACGPHGEDYWNIFNEVTADDRVEENIREIANVLFDERLNRTSQPFFPSAARDLFYALILHYIRLGDAAAKYRNNEFLRYSLDQCTSDAFLLLLQRHPDLRALSSYIQDSRSEQTLGVMSELQQITRDILVGNFKKKGSLSMRHLIRESSRKVIFIEYDLGLGETLTPVYKLLIDLAIKEVLSRNTAESSQKRNVYFILDEFRLLPKLKYIDSGVNFGRSLGAKFIAGIQNIGQVEAAYGPEMAQSVLSGFGSMVSFRVRDAKTREYIKSVYGKNLLMRTYVSAVSSKGISEQLAEGNVIEDHDITNLRTGEAIVGFPAEEPFLIRFNKYK
ncbi:MAG: type IV secretion system DNA-binding domain-containing protein [Solobacterium sp.]|nr:type IV secretion system DNA-binding domain-containing protein [Solobacterium sp.]